MKDESTPERQLLEKLLAERVELDRHIAFLQKRLGMPTPDTSEKTSPSSAPSGSFSAEDLTKLGIQKGEFYGLSRPQAAAALLKKVNKNLTTNQIFEALKETGFDVSSKNALNGLYTALTRNSDIRKVAPNTWGLREWFPHLKDIKKRPNLNLNLLDQRVLIRETPDK
jgi:hypothetical protein